MKRLVCMLIVASLTLTTVPVFAGTQPTNNSTNVSETTSNGLVVNGNMPTGTSLITDSTLSSEVFDKVSNIYDANISKAENEGAFSVDLSYEIKSYKNYVSVVIYTTTTMASGNETVDTVVADTDANKIVNITDVLGPNATQIATSAVMKTIAQNPTTFNPDFDGVTKSQDFYVENGNVVLVFDEYEIAIGAQGIVKIPIALSSVINYTITPDNYFITDSYNVDMIPLRSVCEALGFKVTWDNASHSTVVSTGDFSEKLQTGVNSYNINGTSKVLEEAPQIINGTTYVPISFFSTLPGCIYSIDKNTSEITFTVYNAQ